MLIRCLLVVALLLLPSCDSQSTDQTPPEMDPPRVDPPTGSVRLVEAFPGVGFSQPVDIQQPAAGVDRIFVVEKAGVIRSVALDGSDVQTFLDIRSRVNDGSSEQGLLGLAFHPDYAANGVFFVYHIAGRGAGRSVVARYARDAADPGRADPASEQILLEVDQPFSNHNAGQIAFGPDGFLYVALGDGGSGGDPRENGQDPTTLLGSILRLDVDAPGGYVIPPDNPFVGNPDGFREEIYAYGLRNPWRFSFDPETGALWAADVGQNRLEEIDRIEAGGNYGWNTMEGTRCFDPSSGCDPEGLLLPVAEYGRSEGISVTGGYVYRGADVPALAGRYVYGDFGSGRIWTLDAEADDPTPAELLDTDFSIASFGTDARGELYLADFGGTIYRFAAN
ncbi:MAG: PQQ-dependent sugar dehydrogenase [Rhodothermales bacterium]|nr:PQQ-dependent sugar dehydrogenase [Rhodothermales bacterium]